MNTVYRSTRSFRFVLPVIAIAGVIALIATAIIIRDRANALSATDFEAGNIISDNVFYDKNAMSVQQIQSFLNRLIPTCDTWRNETFVDGEGARVGPPFVCITNYHENPNTGETSFERGGGAFPGGISAAQIIYNAAQEYGINPQVLLVLLKKESLNLTGDTWPTKYQYKFAMGYACPDSGPNNSANCDPSKSGFYKQVVRAAWQFKYYKEHPNDYRYHIGWNDIQYSPNESCGTKRVYIENLATLSLYIYTPYTPNNASLANYPGTASCGAYGNRNFFMFFSEWFGTTREIVKDLRSLGSNTRTANTDLKAGDFITSPNGQYILVMQYSGVLSLYQSGILIWQSSNSPSTESGASLTVQDDGNAVIYDKNGKTSWATNTSNKGTPSLELQNDGNLVLYTVSRTPIWSSGTDRPALSAKLLGDSVANEKRLQQNEFLRSSDWRYFLYMQPDGNLVLYTAGFTQPLWSSGTAGKGGKYVVMQGDGNLVMYGDKGAVWSSGTAGKNGGNALYLQSDGNLVIYNTRSQPLWSSGTAGKGGKYVVMQGDGNLVMYGDKGAVWSSDAAGKGGKYVVMQGDGNLVMYGDKGAVWSSGTAGKKQLDALSCPDKDSLLRDESININAILCSNSKQHQLIMQSDGNLVMYTQNTSSHWASNTTGRFIRSNMRLN